MFVGKKIFFGRKQLGLLARAKNMFSEINRQRMEKRKEALSKIPSLKDFIHTQNNNTSKNMAIAETESNQDYFLHPQNILEDQFKNSEATPYPGLLEKKFHIETYGCQMNFSDTEIINSILTQNGLQFLHKFSFSEVIRILYKKF